MLDLADDGPRHDLWEAMAWTHHCSFLTSGLGDRARWVGHGPPEPVGPDLEMVAFAPTGRPEQATLALMLHFEDGSWKVAGLVLK